MEYKTTKKSRKWYFSLWFWVLVFMCAGATFGLLAPDSAKQLKFIIDNFIFLIKLMVGPIIFCTVVGGIIGMGSLKQLGTIGLKAFVYFEIISTLSLLLGLGFGYLFQPGAGMDLTIEQIDPSLVTKYTTGSQQALGLKDICLSAIPSDPFSPFMTGNTLQILFMAICSGFILFYAGAQWREKIVDKLHVSQDFLFKILGIVMWLSPLAAFAAMAFMLGQFGVTVIWHMLGLLSTMLFACIFFIVVVLGLMARQLGFSIFKFLRFISDEILLVFATSSSESALGPIMKKMKSAGVSPSVVGIVIPAGYSFNLDGTNIYLALVIAFLSQAFNIELTWQEHLFILLVLMVTSKGAAGVSGSGFIVLAGTLAAMNGKIPVITIAILLGIDKIMSELRSTTNLVGNSIAAVVVAYVEKKLDIERFQQALDKKI